MKKHSILGLMMMVAILAGAISSVVADLIPPICGAVTDRSAVILVFPGYSDGAQAIISTSKNMANPIIATEKEGGEKSDGVVKYFFRQLKPSTAYYYALVANGSTAKQNIGMFYTFPPPQEPASFEFCFGNSLKHDLPNSALYTVAKRKPLFFLNTGDLFYADIAKNNIAIFRNAYRTAYRRRDCQTLHRNTSLIFMWDDHDFGPNNSDSRSPGKQASLQAYRELVPHYPLVFKGAESPIAQTFTVGRVLFIMTDLRSARDHNAREDGPEKTMMGPVQKEWFKKKLLTAKNYGLVVWVSSVPWTAKPAQRGDHWGGFTHERTEIANFIRDQKIENLLVISGDAHSLAADDGSNGDYSTGGGAPLATIIAAPLCNRKSSVKGGPYSQGTYSAKSKENCYGYVRVIDNKDSVELSFRGLNQDNVEKLKLDIKFPVKGKNSNK